MTKNVIPGSIKVDLNKTISERLINDYGGEYEIPQVLDAAICIFLQYVAFGERLFTYAYPLATDTSSQGIVKYFRVGSVTDPILIGNFSSLGLHITEPLDIYKGIAACRNL